jgi:hypothetical protein
MLRQKIGGLFGVAAMFYLFEFFPSATVSAEECSPINIETYSTAIKLMHRWSNHLDTMNSCYDNIETGTDMEKLNRAFKKCDEQWDSFSNVYVDGLSSFLKSLECNKEASSEDGNLSSIRYRAGKGSLTIVFDQYGAPVQVSQAGLN